MPDAQRKRPQHRLYPATRGTALGREDAWQWNHPLIVSTTACAKHRFNSSSILTPRLQMLCSAIPINTWRRLWLGHSGAECARVEVQSCHLYTVHDAPVGVAHEEVRTVGAAAALEGDARHVHADHREQEVLVPLHPAHSCCAPSASCVESLMHADPMQRVPRHKEPLCALTHGICSGTTGRGTV